MKLVDEAKRRVNRARRRFAFLDHGVRAVVHYVQVQGGVLAGGITYYGYLSVFPVLVLAFAVVGAVTNGDRRATEVVTDAMNSVLPGLVGTGEGQLSLTTVQGAAATVGLIGVATLLYSGLGWLSALRQSLQDVFTLPRESGRNFLVGKAVDLLALTILAVVLVVSVALTTAVTTFTDAVLGWLSLDDVPGMGLMVRGLAVLLGVLSSTVLFLVMFHLLPQPELPPGALVRGALVAALGFEALKLLATTLIRLASNNPATAVFGTSLVLLIWINYFSRVTILGAAWAVTTGQAHEVLPELRAQARGDSDAPMPAPPPEAARLER